MSTTCLTTPCSEDPFSYLKMQCTASRWPALGACMNWLTTLIAYDMSGHVMAR